MKAVMFEEKGTERVFFKLQKIVLLEEQWHSTIKRNCPVVKRGACFPKPTGLSAKRNPDLPLLVVSFPFHPRPTLDNAGIEFKEDCLFAHALK